MCIPIYMVYIYCVQTWLHTIIYVGKVTPFFYFSVQVGGFFFSAGDI